MRSYTGIALVAAALILGAVLWLFIPGDEIQEPLWKGKPASVWANEPEEFELMAADLGPGMFPWFRKVLRSGSHRETAEVSGQGKVQQARVRRCCLYVLQEWGPEAQPLAEELLRLARSDADAPERAMALAGAVFAAPQSAEVREVLNQFVRGEDSERSKVAGLIYKARVQDTNFLAPLERAVRGIRPGQPMSRQPMAELMALSIQSSTPSNVVAELVRGWEDRSLRGPILGALLEWGPQAKPALPMLVNSLAEKQDSLFWPEILHVLAIMGPEAEPASSSVGRLMESRDPVIRGVAAFAAARMRNVPGFAVEVLTNQLQNTNYEYSRAVMPLRLEENLALGHREAAAWFLGELGLEAVTALPVLKQYLESTDLRLSLFCARAVWRCEAQREAVIPVLQKALESGNLSSVLLACRIAGEMEAEAEPLNPFLQRAMRSNLRARAACWSTLRQINQTSEP